MTGPYGAVNGNRITSGSLTMGYFGRWVADFALAAPDPIAAACTVTLGQLSLAGTVVRSAPYAGLRSVRVVAGADGWGGALARRSYQFSGGVPLSMVLGDAASELGERVRVASDAPLGAAWTRAAQLGMELLRTLAPLWWIDAAGVTRVASSRPSPAITSDFTVISSEPGAGEYEIATEALQDWIPGATFSGPTITDNPTVSSATFRVDNEGKLRVHVLSQGAVVQ